MIRVKATREGCLDQRTASGYIVERHVPFVALPDREALYRVVRIHNPLTTRECLAFVLDIGPWNVSDYDYVFGGARPQAESGVDRTGRHTNGAGIDLGEYVWFALGLSDNTLVDWQFVECGRVDLVRWRVDGSIELSDICQSQRWILRDCLTALELAGLSHDDAVIYAGWAFGSDARYQRAVADESLTDAQYARLSIAASGDGMHPVGPPI